MRIALSVPSAALRSYSPSEWNCVCCQRRASFSEDFEARPGQDFRKLPNAVAIVTLDFVRKCLLVRPRDEAVVGLLRVVTGAGAPAVAQAFDIDRKSTRLNSSHLGISYAA